MKRYVAVGLLVLGMVLTWVLSGCSEQKNESAKPTLEETRGTSTTAQSDTIVLPDDEWD